VERFEIFVRGMSRYFEWAGVIGLLAMFFTNLIDVVGAKLFNWPLPGALEIISFSLLVAIAPAIAHGLFLGVHLRIDFIIEKFPKTLRFVLDPLVSIICMILFILIFWNGLEYGYSLQKAGEIGSSSKIPFFPFAYVLAISCVPAALYFVLEAIKSVKAKP